MNHQSFLLQKQAVESAKNGEWQQAVEKNKLLVDLNPKDIGALNRLGFSLMQLKKNEEAKKIYQQVLEIDKLNSVAKKYLNLLQTKKAINIQRVSTVQDFVEEPGKSKVIVLDRLSGAESLNHLPVASLLTLKPKGRYITVNTQEGEYVGSFPEDISFHLANLLKTGNLYSCVLRSASKQECSVFVRETFRSPENQNVPSFYFFSRNQGREVDEDLLLADMMDDTLTEDAGGEDEAEKNADDDSSHESKEALPSEIMGNVDGE